jgi:hypothetical protein
MARKFLVPIDLQKNELQNAVVQNLAGSPASPVQGQIYFDSSAKVLYYYNGAGWVNAGGISSGLFSARPTVSAANAGSFYHATDNHLVYYSDGVVWSQLNEFGAVANLGAVASDGAATEYSRADHVHRHDNTDHSSINISALAVPTSSVSWNEYKITNLANPENDQDAATKYYVDNAIAGLTWKESVHLLATTQVALTGTTGSLVIDGHDPLTQLEDNEYRILLTGQTIPEENGIYSYADNGTTYTMTRSSDADSYSELIGASVFIKEGLAYGQTGWVQAEHYLEAFADQVWVQFSGTGTYNAGAGLTLDGNLFNVGTVSTSRIVVNTDSIDLAEVSRNNSTNQTSATSIQSITTDSYGRVTDVVSGTHPLSSTTTAGIASFADANFTVTSGEVSSKGINLTAGSGISLSTTAVTLGGSLTVTNSGVLSVDGTTDQVTATTVSGAVTLGLPQAIATTSTPTFGGLTLSDPLAIASGGTGATTSAGVKSNLGYMTRYVQNVGTGSTTSVTVTHNLDTQDVIVQIFDNTSPHAQVECDVNHTSNNAVTLVFASAPTLNQYRVVVIG